MAQPKSLKDIEAELGGLGAELTLNVRVAGLVDFGREVQVQLPDGLLTYLPIDSLKRAAGLP